MPENDIRASVTIAVKDQQYTACLKLGTLKAIEAETGIGVMALWQQCRDRTSKLTDQAIVIGLALKAANPTWGNNKIQKILEDLKVVEHYIYATSLLNLSVLEPTDSMKEATAEAETETATEADETSPLH